MKIANYIQIIEQKAPLSVSYEAISNGAYDNSGFLIGDINAELKKVLVCLDESSEAVDLAIEKGCNLIVSHHPFIYAPIKNVLSNDYKGKVIIKLIKNDIAVYSTHLSMDMTVGGIDDEVANMLGITVDTVYEKLSYGGYGKFGTVESQSFMQYVQKVRDTFDIVRYSGVEKNISKVCTMCGSGTDNKVVNFAKSYGVDVLISCEIANHLVMELNESGINVIELSHGEEELKAFKNIMKKIETEINLNEVVETIYFNGDFRLISV